MFQLGKIRTAVNDVLSASANLLGKPQPQTLVTQLANVQGTLQVGKQTEALGPVRQVLDNVNTELTDARHAVVTTLAKWEEHYQAFFQNRIDPLFGAARNEHLHNLTVHRERAPLSPPEKEMNRALGIATLAVGAAIAGHLLFPPLLLGAVGGAIYLTWPIYQRAYYMLTKQRRLTIAVPAAIYMTGTWLTGYFVAGALGELVYYLGEKLIMITEDRSRKNLVNVFGQQPQFVWVVVDGNEIEIPFEQVQVGDTLVLQAGQVIPVDGQIISGVASIDQHALTGEAQPAEKGAGAPVFAATVVLAGKIHVRVEKTGEATVAAQIGTILNNTASYQMSLEMEGLRMANKAALPVLLVGGLALPIVGAAGAVAALSANFGFNLKMMAPLSMLNFLNLASRQGILIKDGRSLELLNTVDTVVFDKTGTLTLEEPHVVHIVARLGLSQEAVLMYAAAAEQRQSHPIARAILTAANERSLALPTIDEARYEVGYGIQVVIDGKRVRVGSERFIQLEGVTLPPEIQRYQQTCHEQGHSVVMIALDTELAGLIELKPTIRPEAKTVIGALHTRGLKLYIISGDQEQPTRTLATELGIDHYFANTLPENKAALVEQLQQEGRAVCFVGDGINDAIALKKANVSVSLRGATTVATDTAQIVFMDQTLQQLPHLFELARSFNENLQTGLKTALVPGAIVIGGVFLLHFGIPAAIFINMLGLSASLGVAMAPVLNQSASEDNATPVSATETSGQSA